MLRLFITLCLFTTSVWSAQAPNFVLNSNNQLSDLQGQVVYVDFWASWCKPCRTSFPWMQNMQNKYPGLKVLTINLDEDKSNAQQFMQKLGVRLPVIFDPNGDIASQYQLMGMPSSYIIDKSGNIRFSHQGFFTAKQAQYEAQIQQLLQEKKES